MPKYSSLQTVQAAIAKEETTCEDIVHYYLKQIESSRHLNAYVQVFAEEALTNARALDIKYQTNPASVGKLFGMVVAIKDVLCYEGHQVTAASKILKGFTSLFSCTAVERLIAEDAIIIGSVNCDEFAMGSSNENSSYGVVRNALDTSKVPGGSSGGSAVAVQADTCLAALGTDTGGSVRQPAAFCGNIGFKPTYGRISRHGVLAYASSFDQIGVIANSTMDVALMLETMAGADEYDSTVSTKPVETYSKKLEPNQKFRIAYFDTALHHQNLDACIKTRTFNLIEQLKSNGHTVEAVSFDYMDYIIPAYYTLTTAEASANLSRYDGIKYGYRSPNAGNLYETYTRSRSEGFGSEVKRRIILGTFVLSSGYYDAYYTKAQKVRRLVQENTLEILKNYDFIIMPTTPSPAFEIGKETDDPVEVYLADIYTVLANLAGLPAISLPFAKHDNGMPIGVQLLANKFEETKLLGFSQSIMENFVL